MESLKDILFYLLGLLYKLYRWAKEHVDVIVALATLITSIVTCQVSMEQKKIVDVQLKLQKKEAQPIFEIKKGLLDHDHDGCDDTEYFSVSIVKNEVREICDVKTYTFYKIDEILKNDSVARIEKTVYVPILWYHNHYGGPFGHIGTVACDTTLYNYWAYLSFLGDCMLSKPGEKVSYKCNKIDFIEISYLDIYGTNHTVYFEDASLSTPEQFIHISNKSKEVFENCSYNIYVKLDHILSDMKTLSNSK